MKKADINLRCSRSFYLSAKGTLFLQMKHQQGHLDIKKMKGTRVHIENDIYMIDGDCISITLTGIILTNWTITNKRVRIKGSNSVCTCR